MKVRLPALAGAFSRTATLQEVGRIREELATMARPLVFERNGREISLNLEKIDRSALYGYIRKEVEDGSGKKCRLVTLAGDGKTLIDSGGTAIAYLDSKMLWRDKASLRPVDAQGCAVEAVPSSFNAPLPLCTEAAVDDLLGCNIHASYLLTCETEIDAELLATLRSGKIFTCPFSYRGGLEADCAFILAAPDGSVWMLLGKPVDIQFLGMEVQAADAEEDAADEGADGDLMDFGMM